MRSWKKDNVVKINLGFLTFHLVPYKGDAWRVTEELEYLVGDPKKFTLCGEIGGMVQHRTHFV